MDIPKEVQAELDKRDELILALEMMTVDQACRLLALEAIVANTAGTKKASKAAVQKHIERESERFKAHFEGDSVSGFADRAKRIASSLLASTAGPKKRG